jgi:copper chaperone CopZ
MSTSYAVDGMTCDACRVRVKNALRGVAERVSVTLTPASATLDGGSADQLPVLNAALASVGAYRLRPASDSAAPARIVPSPAAPSLAAYWPLIVIIGFLLIGSLATNVTSGGVHWHGVMNAFMGAFFLVFAAFKFLDLRGFAAAYASYDLLAMRWRGYGYVYPFLEAGLGIAYLSGIAPAATALLTIGLMGFSSLGVIAALREKRVLRCACLCTVLNLPMTTVTVVEDLGMAAMAALMLI